MVMKLWKSIKAISSIIAVIILIAITISGGLLVFAVMTSTLTGSNQRTQVNFESLSLYLSTGEPKVVFTATLKNTGNRPIKQLTLKVHNESDYSVPSVTAQNPLEPGRTVGVTLTPPKITAERYVVGNAYSVTVKAEAVDGSTFSTVTSVTCLGIGEPASNKKTVTFYSTDGIKPIADEFVEIYSNEGGEGYKPMLIINYTSPVTPQIFEYFHEKNQADALWGGWWLSQTFTPLISHDLSKVVFYGRRWGNPAGYLTVSIRMTDEDGKPVGSDLISKSVLAGSISGTAGEIEMVFDTTLHVEADTKYAIIFSCPNGDAGSNNIWIYWYLQGDKDYPRGNYAYSYDGETWEIKLGEDCWFEEWGYQTEEIKFEYYNTGDDSVGMAYSNYWVAQTFTVGATGHTVTSVKLLLCRAGSPGTVTVSIRATDGTHPTGTDLTSGTIDGNSLTTNSAGAWYEIVLTEYPLSANTKYAIVVQAPSAPSGENYLY